MEQASLHIDDLRLLEAVGLAGSLAGAARIVGVNHASAWRRLGALEARLGVRLFDRHRTGYTATPAGEEAVDRARNLLADIAEMERRLAGQDIRPSGLVRLTTAETLLDLVAPVVAELRQAHPGILIEVSTANAFLTLTRREADIALRPAAVAPNGLVARRLGTVATAVYAAPAYVERAGCSLDTVDWLAPDDSLSHLGSARWIAANVSSERIVHRAGSLLALAAVARANLGAAPLPCVLADADPNLVRLAGPIDMMATNLWLLTHPDLRNTARIRVVLDALHDSLSKARQRLAGDKGGS